MINLHIYSTESADRRLILSINSQALIWSKNYFTRNAMKLDLTA